MLGAAVTFAVFAPSFCVPPAAKSSTADRTASRYVYPSGCTCPAGASGATSGSTLAHSACTRLNCEPVSARPTTFTNGPAVTSVMFAVCESVTSTLVSHVSPSL